MFLLFKFHRESNNISQFVVNISFSLTSIWFGLVFVVALSHFQYFRILLLNCLNKYGCVWHKFINRFYFVTRFPYTVHLSCTVDLCRARLVFTHNFRAPVMCRWLCDFDYYYDDFGWFLYLLSYLWQWVSLNWAALRRSHSVVIDWLSNYYLNSIDRNYWQFVLNRYQIDWRILRHSFAVESQANAFVD